VASFSIRAWVAQVLFKLQLAPFNVELFLHALRLGELGKTLAGLVLSGHQAPERKRSEWRAERC
jgi:hypothetical protein